ncbi:MAG TPA: hypothetical protein V6C71_09020 [Coleofasciculaceae cyanobacterium]
MTQYNKPMKLTQERSGCEQVLMNDKVILSYRWDAYQRHLPAQRHEVGKQA